ncbi:MAG TPA: DUF1467 family protein [Rhizomicrobium sp.]
MHWVVLAGAYVILWFLALQILLPMGIGAPHSSGEAIGDPGAPPNPRLALKALIATFAAAAIWSVFFGLVLAGIIHV